VAIVRVADFAAVSTAPWRRLVPHRNSSSLLRSSGAGAGAGAGRALPRGAGAPFGRGGGVAPPASAVFSSARLASISSADSRSTVVSYFAPTGLRARTVARSSIVIAPMRQRGGQIHARSTGIGTAFSCSIDTSASPTPSSEITRATSIFGLGTKVSAAVFTDFMSRGVYARSACWMRLPSWPSTSPGMSSGFCEQKNTPTPFERIRRTTCSMRCCSAGGQSSKSRCASSNTNTSFGCSRSPTSGRRSNNSDSSHSRNEE
jgi:hypothetical protein